jgi:hypothetical protein
MKSYGLANFDFSKNWSKIIHLEGKKYFCCGGSLKNFFDCGFINSGINFSNHAYLINVALG